MRLLASLACLGGLLAARLAPSQEAHPTCARGWDGFPVLVWRTTHAREPLTAARVAPFNGVILMRDEDSAWARAEGLDYLVWNVAGRAALHLDPDATWTARVERWIETQDPELLRREPCLAAPATHEELERILAQTLARHGAQPGLGLVLGDEVSLTPNGDPFDLCRCAPCEESWRQHARTLALPERAPLTDEVRRGLLEEDHSLLGAWLERRRFEAARVESVLAELARRARGAEGRPVGLLGLRGRTAFGGVDVELACRAFDFVEGYPTLDTRALLASASPRRQLVTLFLADESADGAAWLAWRSWLDGADALVLWSDTELEADPARRARLGAAVDAIRALQARFPGLRPPGPIRAGLLDDADSTALAWLRDARLDGPTWPRRRQGLQDQVGSRERVLAAWNALAAERHVVLGATTLAGLGRSELTTLILPEVLVLSPADTETLAAFLTRGGTLVVDGTLGWVGRDGRPPERSALERLRAVAPERVLVVAADAPEASRRALARRVLEDATPLTVRAGDVPLLVWTRARSDGEPGALVGVLPQAADREARALLAPLSLEIAGLAPGCTVEWIRPAPGEPLAPGDAALFLVRDAADPPRAR